VKVQYVRSSSVASRQSNCDDSLARQSSFKCVDGGDIIIVNDDDNEDVDGQSAAWQCTNCYATNPGSVAQCISCLALQVPDSQLVEDARKGIEKLSDAEDGKVEAMDCEDDDDDDSWVCVRCTLQNVSESHRCELCEAPRHSSVSFSNCALASTSGQRDQRFSDKHIMLSTDNSNVQAGDLGPGVDESDNITSQFASNIDMQNTDWAVWTCSNCTYNNNPSWANFCDVCEMVKQVYNSPQKKMAITQTTGKAAGKMTVSQHKEKVTTSWQCTKCKMVNANSVRDCNCCGALRMMADFESVQNTWTCTKCTLRNNNMAHVCAACLSKRNTALPHVEDINTKWPCPKCTCVNCNSQNFCQACAYDRQTPCSGRGDHKVPGKATSCSPQRKSVFVKEQQLKEEMAAHDQWIQIVNFCKVVTCHSHDQLVSHLQLGYDAFLITIFSVFGADIFTVLLAISVILCNVR